MPLTALQKDVLAVLAGNRSEESHFAGGSVLGSDRLIAILCGTSSIRDVIAFPNTAKGTCLMTDSPSAVSARQLRDLHIDVKAAVKKDQPPAAPPA